MERGSAERLSEEELRRFRSGDAAHFRELVEVWSPRLLAVVRPFARDMDEAQDLLQETWRRIYEKRATYMGTGTLLGWFYAVCRNVCLGLRRRENWRGGSAEGMTEGPAGLAEPEPAAERVALRRSLQRAIMELPEREREVVILRLLGSRSTRETAEALGCAEGTVKAALHHAVIKLQAALEVWVR